MATNITNLLTKQACYCLNEHPLAPHSNLFVGDHTLPLKSDADAQIILHLAFNETVKLTALEIGIPADESCPSIIKLFKNINNLGFSEATGKLIL
jgi:hypothetical protein